MKTGGLSDDEVTALEEEYTRRASTSYRSEAGY